MNTRVLMAASAAAMFAVGATATFLPQEILSAAGATVNTESVLIVQIGAALYLGFGFMNWMARGVLIGGIYSRPLALGNFLHFAIVAMALVKAMPAIGGLPIIAVTIVYVLFAAWFGRILFTSPV